MPPINPFTRSCLALAIGQAMVMPVQSATITVNTTTDVDGAGPCTLREAITSIQEPPSITGTGCTYNGLFGVDDTVAFDSGLSGQTILLSQATALSISGQLTNNFTINAVGEANITIDGNGGDRVFKIVNSSVTLNELTITGGSSAFGGGGLYTYIYSTVSLVNSNVSGNSASSGGGVFAAVSKIDLINSSVSGNSAGSRGGGIFATAFASISLNNSTVSGNSASSGGGIYGDESSRISLHNSTVSGNSSSSSGGGIYALDRSSARLTNSTVSGNSAASVGGGIRVDDGTATLQNTTVSNNSAISNGGISAANSASVSLSNSTVSGNSAGLFNGGIGASTGSSVSLSNSIIAGNRAPNVNAEVLNNASTITANNGNLFGDAFHSNDAAAFGNFSPGVMDINANSTDGLGIPLASILEPLGDNGGPTQTHALVVDSPAIDAGNNASCLDTDQRGQPRSDGECDIGAYEFIESNIFVVPLPNGRVVIFEL